MANIITLWSQFYLTDTGLRLRQKSIAEGVEIAFTYAKIGQGVPSSPNDVPLMTDIIAAAEEVPVVRSVAEGVTHYVGVRVDNKDFEQPVLMTEIGLFAKIGDDAPVLYGYTYATQGYDSIPAGKVAHYVWTIGIDTVISRSQSITFTYDGSEVYATEDEIDQLIQAFDAFKGEIREELNKAVEVSDKELPSVGVKIHFFKVKDVADYIPFKPESDPSDITGVEEGMLETEEAGCVRGYIADGKLRPMAISTE